MSLSNPRVIYGIHSALFYNPKTGERYGMLRVLGNGSFTMEGETNELRGGSSKFPWSIQDGNINAKIDLQMKEYPDFVTELLLGKKTTHVTSDTAGAVNGYADVVGTSLSTSISAVAPLIASKANLKFGKYLLKAVDATHVDLYASTNIDFNRGTDVDFADDTLKVNSSPIVIATGSNDLASHGLRFTGAGSVALVAGDTAVFEVVPPHAGYSEVVIGGDADVFPEFGVVLYAQQNGDGAMVEIDVFKAKAIGMNIGMQEKAFSEAPISAKCYKDSTKGGICKMRFVNPS